MKKIKLLLAGGGTGGHLFPGIAVAEEFLSRNRINEVLFIGTNAGLEKTLLPKLGYRLRTIRIGGLYGRGTGETIKNLALILPSMMQALRIIGDFRPDLALGVGGYSSGPAILAARLAGIKTAIAEQNAQPGMTNRILGGLVHRVFITYPETAAWFSPSKTLLTGNPVRKGFLLSGGQEPGHKEEKFNLLIFGGSQGAAAINEAMLEALLPLKAEGLQLSIIHQTGQKELGYVKEAYAACGVEAEVVSFIVDMPAVMRKADLIICRAGATSLAEITALGKAAILVPYPYATHDHQTKNAAALAALGAAEMIPQGRLTGRLLAAKVSKYYHKRALLAEMGAKAAAMGRPDAAARIVDGLLALVEKKEKNEKTN